jgi:hypothetical protein
MKEFDKWFKKNQKERYFYHNDKVVWKAALEWVEENFDWQNNGNNLSILLKELES